VTKEGKAVLGLGSEATPGQTALYLRKQEFTSILGFLFGSAM